MTTILTPKCYNCKNAINLIGDPPTCAAFPDGIPDPILWEGEPHNAPLPTQTNSIVFEPIEPNR